MIENANKKFLAIREAAAFTGMGQGFLRKSYQDGVIKGYTTPAGQRRFCVQSLREFCELSKRVKEEPKKINFLYSRVSSKKQYDDLERQVEFLQTWATNTGIEYNVIKDIGSGINFKRKGLQTILDSCLQGVIGNVAVAHRDRLSRFGFDLIESIVNKAGGKITVINDSGNKSSEQELAEDLLSIVHIYSCRQMGKRSYKGKQKRNNENNITNIPSNPRTENTSGSESES